MTKKTRTVLGGALYGLVLFTFLVAVLGGVFMIGTGVSDASYGLAAAGLACMGGAVVGFSAYLAWLMS